MVASDREGLTIGLLWLGWFDGPVEKMCEMMETKRQYLFALVIGVYLTVGLVGPVDYVLCISPHGHMRIQAFDHHCHSDHSAKACSFTPKQQAFPVFSSEAKHDVCCRDIPLSTPLSLKTTDQNESDVYPIVTQSKLKVSFFSLHPQQVFFTQSQWLESGFSFAQSGVLQI